MNNYNNKINKVFIHQPDFAPWITFFKRLFFSNMFVVLDDVQFNRRGWINRDYLKFNSKKTLITIPVYKSNRENTKINDVKINYNNRWFDKLLNSIEQNYSNTTNFTEVSNFIKQLIKKKHEKLINFNLNIINFVMKKINIKTDIIYSSDLKIKSSKSEKILDICKKLHATHYITGSGSKNYLNLDNFKNEKIEIIDNIFFNEIYNQNYGKFIKELSIFDVLFNVEFKQIENLIKKN